MFKANEKKCPKDEQEALSLYVCVCVRGVSGFVPE